MVAIDGEIDLKGSRWRADPETWGYSEGAHLLIRGPEDLPFTKANVEGRADEFYIGSVIGWTPDDYDIDGAGECGRVQRREFLVVLIRSTDSVDSTTDVVHGKLDVRQLPDDGE